MAYPRYSGLGTGKMADEPERLVRIPLPISLIRRIDGLIRAGVGGFRDRGELIKEALEEYVLELSLEKAPELIEPITPFEEARWAEETRAERHDDLMFGGRSPSSSPKPPYRGLPQESPPTGNVPPQVRAVIGNRTWGRSWARAQLDFAELSYPGRGKMPEGSTGKVRDEPMFGLHNRDYPSLWAATRIARLTIDELIEWEALRELLLEDAWQMGAELLRLDKPSGQKLSALFPTNSTKRPSAEDAFWNFAVGTLGESKEGEVHLSGPLFLWRILAAEAQDENGRVRILVGLTEKGYQLLDAVAGLTPEVPHRRELAQRFFDYLRQNAPSDWWGFATVLSGVGTGIARTELIEHFHKALLDEIPRESALDPWTEVQAATNTAGYVARAREWGLLELKQHRGLYLMTDFGREIVSQPT